MEEGKIKKYIAHLGSKKQLWIIVCGVVLGAALLLFAPEDKQDAITSEIPSDNSSIILYEAHLEEKIRKLCESISGVFRVRVMVTLDGGFEHVYARDDEYLTAGSRSSRTPVPVKDKLPSIRGIGIVCDGAQNPVVQKEICNLLSAALDISSNRIYIANGK